MDTVALHILCRELEDDARVLMDAANRAGTHLANEFDGSPEACAYELNRAYNVVEKAFERICTAFENHFEKRGDYHERLIKRIALEIPGFRPAFLPGDQVARVRDLKNFRHVFRHAYELELRKDRLAELVKNVKNVASEFPRWVGTFESTAPGYFGSSADGVP